jgi:very-short-patch-repair endonuclease
MINCKECDTKFETLDSLRRHRKQKHGVNAEQTYIDYVLNGVEPKCKCGCGEKPKYMGIDVGYRDYIKGHASRVNNNWGHNKEALKKSHETQKKMHASGKLTIWNKGLTIDDNRVKDNITKTMSNPNRGINISKKLSDIPKSEEHKKKIKEKATIRWSKEGEREKQSQRVISRLINNNYRNPKTKLEKLFQSFMEELGFVEDIDFKYQYQISTSIYDFYFIENHILIEVDGDFHHCNPNTKHKIPIYDIQLKTIGNDYKKNMLAEEKGLKLLRFWETDIKTNKDEVVKILKQELGL